MDAQLIEDPFLSFDDDEASFFPQTSNCTFQDIFGDNSPIMKVGSEISSPDDTPIPTPHTRGQKYVLPTISVTPLPLPAIHVLPTPTPPTPHSEETTSPFRNHFTPEEDAALIEAVEKMGNKNWDQIKLSFPKRTKRQLRDRYQNYLNPTIQNNEWTDEEDILLERLVSRHGRQWAKIVEYFQGRTNINVKNRYCSKAHYKAIRQAMGFRYIH